MFKKFVCNHKSERSSLSRTIRLFIASGMIAMPWTGLASEIVRTDSGPAITPVGSTGAQVHNIYAAKDLGNAVGANTFSKFNVTAGDVANMHFRQSPTNSAAQFNTLLNFVDSKININGTVNAIRDAKIGGHLFFLSPQGMVVGKNGAINAGALTVMAATNNWWEGRYGDDTTQFSIDKFTSSDLSAVQNLAIPINATGTIAVAGKINVTNDIRMKAGKINIGMDDDSLKNAAQLTSGVTDFSQIVNVDMLKDTGITDVSTLTATVAGDGGDIIIAAEVSMNENDCAATGLTGKLIDKQEATAEVNVVGGSKIIALRNVDITATAVNNVSIEEYVTTDQQNTFSYIVNGSTLTEDEFKSQYVVTEQEETETSSAMLALYGQTTRLHAKVNITNDGAEAGQKTTIQGTNVNIQAEAHNVYTNTSSCSYIDDDDIDALTEDDVEYSNTDFWFSYLFNGLDVVYSDSTTDATVTIGADTIVVATAQDTSVTSSSGTTYTPALQVGASSTLELTLGTKALSINASGNQSIPGIGFIWGQAKNEANVTIAGQLTAEKGSAAVKSNATAKIKETADTGYGMDGRALTSDAGLNFGVVVLCGENYANVNLTDTSSLTSSGNATVAALSINTLNLNNVLKTSDNAATAFGISWEQYGSQANVNVAGKVESTSGSVITMADNEFTANEFITQAEAGDAGFLSGFTKYYRKEKEEVSDNITDKLRTLFSGGTSGSGSSSGSRNIDDLLSKLRGYDMGSGLFQTLNEKLKLGVSLGVMSQDNQANVNIASTGSLVANKGAVSLSAKVNMSDIRSQVYGASANEQPANEIDTSGGTLGTGSTYTAGQDLMANGAVMLVDVVNDASITMENGAQVTGAYGVSMQTDALMPYNRINNMIKLMEYCCDVVKHSFDNLTSSGTDVYSENDKNALNDALKAFSKDVEALKKELYEDDGVTLKEKYADSSDGYSALIAELDEVLNDETNGITGFATLLSGGTYSYTDDDGQQHTLYFDYETKDGSAGLMDTIETAIGDLETAIGGCLGVVNAAINFAEPSNYLNYYVGAATKGTKKYDNATNVAIAAQVGLVNSENISRIIVGDGAKITTYGDVAVTANTEANDATLTGKIGTTGGGKKCAIGVAVGLSNINNTSLITMADNSSITGKNINFQADNYTNHIVIGEVLNSGTGNSSVAVDAVVLIAGGESNSIINLDNEADLTANGGTIALNTENTTNTVMVAGGLAIGNKGAESAAFGMIMFDRNNYSTIADNDYDKDNDSEKDEEKQRIWNIVNDHSGVDRSKYFGKTDTVNKGEISAISLTNQALSDGDLVNVVMDVGYGSDTAYDTACKAGQKVSGAIGGACDTVGSWGGTLSDHTDRLKGAINDKMPDGGSSNGGSIPTVSFSGTGSVSLNDIDSYTVAMIDGTNITLVKDETTANLKNYAEDTGTLVSVAGGVSYSNKKGGSGMTSSGDKTGIAMAAGAAVNLVDSYTTAQISNSSIEQAKTITNEAYREGLLVAAAAGVDVVRSESGSGSGAVVGGATSVNIGNYGTKANLKNNQINVEFDKDSDKYVTNLTNQAKDQDAQGAGCLNLNLALKGKTSVSIGGVVSYDELHNNVEANMTEGGTYLNLGDVFNVARTDLTQVQAALGMGITASSSGKTTVDLEGSAAVGIFANDLQAKVDGGDGVLTLVANNFVSKAYDEKFDSENYHLKVACGAATAEDYGQGFDLYGKDYLKAASEEALDEGESLRQEGNTLVNVAVQVGAAAGSSSGTNVAIGASVGVVISDSEFLSSINNANITANTVDTLAETSTLEVGVAAGGNGSSKGFAGGGSVAVNLMEDEVKNEVRNSTIKADVVTMQALNTNELINVTAEVAVGTSKASALGLDATYNYLDTSTDTLLENTDVFERNTQDVGTVLTLKADNDADYYSVAVGVTVAGGDVAINGSVAINEGINDTSAVASSDNNNTLSLSDFTVQSSDDCYYAAGAGSLGVAYSKEKAKVAVGGAVGYNRLGVRMEDDGSLNVERQKNLAQVSGYDIIKLTGTMDVQAFDEADMVTVGVGVGITTGYVAVQGASADTFLYKDTDAQVYHTNINQNRNAEGTVNVKADTDNFTESIAIVASVSTKYVAVGAAVNVVTMDGDTSAVLAGGNYKVDDMLVDAVSYQKLLSNIVGVAGSGLVAVGGSVTVTELYNDTFATLGYESGNITNVDADGNVGVLAQSKEDFENYTGEAEVAVSTEKAVSVGAGAAVAVNKVAGNTIAKAQNADVNTKASTDKNISVRNSITGGTEIYKGFVVDADAYHKFYDAPWSGGLSLSTQGVAIGVNATVADDKVSGSTKAVVNSVSLNKYKTGSIEEGNDFVVQATDKTDAEPVITNALVDIAISGSVGVGIGLGAGVSCYADDRSTEVSVTGDKDNNRYVMNADEVKVKADKKLELEGINTAVSVIVSTGSTTSVGVSSATGVTYVNLDSVTKATMKDVDSTNNGLSLTSNSDVDFELVDTSVAVAVSASLYGVGIGVGVHVDTIENDSQTITLMDRSNIYHYKDNTAEDVISAKANYYAHNQDCNVSVGASTFSGAVGVLVVDNDLNNVVTVDVIDSKIGTDAKRAKDIDAISLNRVTTDFDNQNVAVSTILSVGVGVGLSTVDASVATNITSSTLYARNDIDVEATQDVTMKGNMVAVPVGCLSVGVSTLHNYLGTAVVDDQFEDWDDENTNAEDLKNNDYSSQNIDDLSVFGVEQANEVLNSVEIEYADYGDIQIDEVVKASRSATVNSEGTKVNFTNANLYAGHDINVLSEEIVNSAPTITAVGVGGLSVQVETNRVRVNNNIGLNVNSGEFVAGNNINLDGATAGYLETNTVMVGVGGVAIGVAIGEITKDGKMGITLETADLEAVGQINIRTKDAMGIHNEGTGSTNGGVAATAVDYKAKDSLVNSITLKRSTQSSEVNRLVANSITVQAYSTPNIKSDFLAVDVALVDGCGVVMESDMNNQAYLTLEGKNTLLANTITLDSGVYADGNDYNLYSDVLGVGVAGVAVHVNKSRTYTNVVTSTTVGELELLTHEEKDWQGNTITVGDSVVTINSFDATNIYNHLMGVTVGVWAASGTNYAQSKIKSNVSTNVAAGYGMYAKDLTITSNAKDVLTSRADGDGGGVVDISPEAAKVETEHDATTTTTISGKFNLAGTLQVEAIRTEDMNLHSDAEQAELAGGSGTKTEINHVYENTTLNMNCADITAQGQVDISSNNYVYLNKDNSYAVDGNGYGGIDAAVSDMKNNMNINATTNIDNSKIIGYSNVNIGANTTGYIVAANSVFSAGIISSNPCGTTESTIVINDVVNIDSGTEVRTETKGSDLNVAASNHLDLFVRAYTEAECGVAGVVLPEARNNLTLKNAINVDNANLYSTQDINLRAGKEVGGNLSYTNIRVESEAFNGNLTGFIPIEPTLENNINQYNTISIGSKGVVRSIRHTELYGDGGQESIQKTSKYYSMYQSEDYGSGYVSTSQGNIEGAINKDNYVQVDGTVIAGIASALTINIGSEDGEYVIVGDQERKAVDDANTRTVYSGSEEDKAKFITFGNEDSQDAAEVIGLTTADFVVGSKSYTEAIGEQLNEVNALLAEYGIDSQQGDEVYDGLVAEQARLEALLKESMDSTSQYPDMVDYIVVPDLVASGGNVNVSTKNFKGSGKVEAKGNPALTINNYTNLMLITNTLTMDDPGGVIYYNSTALDPATGEKSSLENLRDQVQAINASSDGVVLDLAAAKGTTASVSVIGHYDGASINYAAIDKYYLLDENGEKIKYKEENGQLVAGYDEEGKVIYVPYDENGYYYDTVAAGSFKPRADVQISGNINSLKGEAYIESKHNNITIGGDVTEDVSINAQIITIKADNGSISQGYTDGTVNIGGDVQAQYEDEFNSFVKSSDDGKTGVTYTDVSTKLKTYEPTEYGEGSWIAGGQITISANDININGSIQSGYDTYATTVTEADQATIDSIITNWTNAGKQQLTDTTVKNSGNTYIVKEGLAIWNKERQCYEYQLPVYYNPSTKQLVTGDVNASGGKINLTGRIASTGSGRIICMDGAYNINVENQLNLDLRLGELAVNEVTGKITITDSAYNYTTEITSSGAVTKKIDTGEVVTDGPVSGSGTSYEYAPLEGLRYDWVTGYSNTSYTRYYTEEKAGWWGAADYKQKSSGELDKWIEGGQAVTIGSSTGETEDRLSGAYLTTDTDKTADVYFKHTGTTVKSNTHQEGNVEEWSTGFFGCYKWRKYYYVREEGKTFSDYASIAANSPISVTLMGVKAEDSKVTVDTAGDLYFGNMIGNSTLYKSGDTYVEKGSVSLTSQNGSIYQEGSNIYGAKVALSAKNDMQNISIMAGDTVELTGNLTGTGKANITVLAQYGGGIGNVLLNDLGGTNAALVDLTAPGNIIQNTISNLVQAKRINLTSGGVVTGQDGIALRLIGGQDVDADSGDTLKASVNIDAQGNINIIQTSGDIRIGTIYTAEGNVAIEVPDGSVRDALPYVEEEQDTEAELLAKWESMGLTTDSEGNRTEEQIAKDDSLAAGKVADKDYKENIEGQYSDYEQLKKGQDYEDLQAKQSAGLTEDEQERYDQYGKDIKRYDELEQITKTYVELTDEEKQTYSDLYTKAYIDKEPLTEEEQQTYDQLTTKKYTYQTLTEAEQKEYNTLSQYVGYLKDFTDKDKKLYSTYNLKYGEYESADDYLKNDATALAKQAQLQTNVDSITTTTYEGWDKTQLLYALQDSVINQHAGVKSSGKAPNIYANNVTLTVKNDVGLNSPDVTTIDLTTLDTSTQEGLDALKKLSKADAATVTWEEQKIDGKTHKIVTITEKLAIGLHQKDGNGTINVFTTDTNVDNTKNVFLEVRKDQTGANNYLSLNIGTINAAAGNGDVRISSLKDILTNDADTVLSARDVVLLAGEEGTNDGNIGSSSNYFDLNMTGELTATATGNIYLTQSSKDWYINSMAAGNTDTVGTAESGNIYLKAEGNIYGIYNSATDVQGYIQTDGQGVITITSTAGSIGDWNDDNKVLRVKNNASEVQLNAAKAIVFEGVSTDVGGSNAPAGTLKVTEANSGSKQLKLTVNGTLELGSVDYGSVGSIILNVADFQAYNTYSADTVSILGTLGITQFSGYINGNTVTLTVGETLDLTCGVMNVTKEACAAASITQIYDNDNGASSMAKVTAGKLTAKSEGGIDLGAKYNHLGVVELDSAVDTVVGGEAIDNITITNTYDNNEYTAVVGEETLNLQNVTKGGISFRLYDVGQNATGDMTVEGNLRATGNIVMLNAVNDLNSVGTENKVYTDGFFATYAKGSQTQEKGVLAKSGTAYIAEGDIDASSYYTIGQGLYVQSLNGDVNVGNLKSVGLIKGNVALIAEQGSITNWCAFLAEGDITLKAKTNIDNNVSMTLTQEQKNVLKNEYGVDYIDGMGMRSLKGNISVSSLGDGDGEGQVINTTGMRADSGIIELYGKQAVVNNADILAQQGTVTIASYGSVTNGNDTWDYIAGNKGVTVLAGTSVNNTADLYSVAGSVAVTAATTLDNSGKMFTKTGDVTLTSGGSMANTGNIYTEAGNVQATSKATLTNTSGAIFSKNGNVTLTATNDLDNTSSIYALNGAVTLQSDEGNVSNDNPFTSNEGVLSGSINLLAEKGSVNNTSVLAAVTDITIKAMNSMDINLASADYGMFAKGGTLTLNVSGGTLTNSSILKAGKDVLINAYGNIVNSSTGAVTAGDSITVTTEGSLTNGAALTASNKDINLAAGMSLTNTGTLNATEGAMVVASAYESVNNSGDINAKGNVTLQAKTTLTNDGIITATDNDVYITADGDVNNTKDITATLGSIVVTGLNITNEGSFTAGEAVSMIGDNNVSNTKAIKAGADVTLTATDGTLYNEGSVEGSEITVTAGTDLDNDGSLEAGQGITVTAGSDIDNAGSFEAKAGNITVTSGSDLDNDGSFNASQDITVTAGSDIDNAGSFVAGQGITVTAGTDLDNDGTFDAGEEIAVTVGGTMNNSKTFTAAKDIVVKVAKALTNAGAVTTQEGNLIINADDTLTNNGGKLTASKGSIKVTSVSTLTNRGEIKAEKGGLLMQSTAANIDNQAAITAGTAMTMMAATALKHSGNIDAGAGVVLTAKGEALTDGGLALESSGNITAGKAVLLSAVNGALTNNGTVEAKTLGVSMIAKGALQNTGNVQAKTVINMTTDAALTNAGTLTTNGGNVVLLAAGDLNNSTGSDISSGNNVVLKTTNGTIDNDGKILAANYVKLLAENGKIVNDGGTITGTNGYVTMTAGVGEISNKAAITAGKDVIMTAATYIAQDSSVEAGKAVTITALGGTLSAVGSVIAKDGDVTMTSTDAMTTSGGTIKSSTDNVYLVSGKNVTNNSAVEALKNITVTALQDMTNNGSMTTTDSVNGKIDLTAGDELTNSGSLQAGMDIVVTAVGDVTNSGSMYAAQNVDMDGNNLTNTGSIEAGKDTKIGTVTLTATGNLINGDDDINVGIYGATGVIISAQGTVTNYAHILSYYGDVTLGAPLSLTNTGNILAKNGGSILLGSALGEAGTLDNSGKIMTVGGGDVTMISSGDLINKKGGNIFALGGGDVNMTSTTSTLSNAGNIGTVSRIDSSTEEVITECGDVNLTSKENLTNTGFIVTYDHKEGRGNLNLTSTNGSINNDEGNFTITNDVIKAEINEAISKIFTETGFNVDLLQDIISSANLIDGSISLTAENGSVINNKILAANMNINMRALGSVNNNGEALKSLHGSIGLYALGDDGTIENTAGLIAEEGEVYLYAKKAITNNAAITAAVVDLESDGTITNSNKIDVTAYVNTEDSKLEFENNGMITINAKGNIQNGTAKDADVYAKTDKGNIKITSSEGAVTNYSYLKTAEGNVILKAKGDVSNTGNIVAQLGEQEAVQSGSLNTGAGWVALISETGNITNTDNFNTDTAATYAEGSIWLEAPNEDKVEGKGIITNSQDLIANNNIVVKSYNAISMGSNSTKSLEKGNITMVAYRQDEGGVIYNTSEISTADGNIFILSMGSKDVTKETSIREYNEDISSFETVTVNVTAPVSIYNKNTGTIKATNGNVYLKGDRAVINEGDIVATDADNPTPEGVREVTLGNVSAVSGNGGVLLYNVEDSTGTNDFKAEGNILIQAPNGILYNEKNLEADGNIFMDYGGPAVGTTSDGKEYNGKSITIDNYITSNEGDIRLTSKQAGTKLILNTQVTAVEGKIDIISGGDLGVKGEVKANQSAILNASMQAIVLGDVTSEENDVNVAAKSNVAIKGNLTASTENCLVAVGTEQGEYVTLNGDISGKEVVIYTENPETTLSFGSDYHIYVEDELTLAGNYWNAIDMSQVTTDEDGYNLRLFGAGRSSTGINQGGNYDLDFTNSITPAQVNISEAVVETLIIRTDGPITIEDLSVSDKAEIYAMGTKTDVFGKLQDYDGDAKVIYYAPGLGAGAGIDLHDMFFDSTSNPVTIQYQAVMDQYKADSITDFVKGGNGAGSGVDGNGTGMYLDIRSAMDQTGTGILLRNYYRQHTYGQRFSLEQMMQHLLEFKSHEIHNDYFNVGRIDFYCNYNLIEIPDVTVNSSEKTEEELEWEF